MFQAYVGYAWTRFTGIPNNAINLNGFSATLTVFVHGIGIEGELGGGWGNIAGETREGIVPRNRAAFAPW